ncbi:MAG: histidine triad nucleotide-binding protein [Ktedonobacterales bacterium]
MALESDPRCIFCRIVAGASPSSGVYADDTVVAFRDRNPVAPVHVLVVPRRHIPGINAPEALNGQLLSSLTSVANQIAASEGIAKTGYRLLWNVGPDAGQSVFHLHLHLIGGRPLGWPPG